MIRKFPMFQLREKRIKLGRGLLQAILYSAFPTHFLIVDMNVASFRRQSYLELTDERQALFRSNDN